MNPWIIFALVALPVLGVVVWLLLDESIVKVQPGDLGLLLIHGKATDRIVDPGLHFVAALRRRTVVVYPSLELSYRAGSLDLGTPEGEQQLERGGPPVHVVLGDRATGSASFTIRFRIDPTKLRSVHERFGQGGLWSAVRDLGGRAVRSSLNDEKVSVDDIYGAPRLALEERVAAVVRDELAADGFEVTSFALGEIDLGRAGELIQATVRARLDLAREQGEAAMRRERAKRDAEIALLLGVQADSAMRYREVDAWRDLAMEIVHGSVDVPTMPPRTSPPARPEPTTERTEAPAEGTGTEA